MRRATPLEQVQTVPLTRHDEEQVGRTVECDHRKETERGLLPTPSTSKNSTEQSKSTWEMGIYGRPYFES